MSSTKRETLDTRKWIEMQNKAAIWKAVIRGKKTTKSVSNPTRDGINNPFLDKPGGEYSLIIKTNPEARSPSESENQAKMEVISYRDNNQALAKLHELIQKNLSLGYMIRKKVNSTGSADRKNSRGSRNDFYGSYRSGSKGFLNNLTAEDSKTDNSKLDLEGSDMGSVLVKRSLNFNAGPPEVAGSAQVDKVSKKLKTKSTAGKKKTKKKSILKAGEGVIAAGDQEVGMKRRTRSSRKSANGQKKAPKSDSKLVATKPKGKAKSTSSGKGRARKHVNEAMEIEIDGQSEEEVVIDPTNLIAVSEVPEDAEVLSGSEVKARNAAIPLEGILVKESSLPRKKQRKEVVEPSEMVLEDLVNDGDDEVKEEQEDEVEEVPKSSMKSKSRRSGSGSKKSAKSGKEGSSGGKVRPLKRREMLDEKRMNRRRLSSAERSISQTKGGRKRSSENLQITNNQKEEPKEEEMIASKTSHIRRKRSSGSEIHQKQKTKKSLHLKPSVHQPTKKDNQRPEEGSPVSKIPTIVSSQMLTPPKIDYREIAKFNTVPIQKDQPFLTEDQIRQVFSSKPPKYVPQSSFKGIYLERKVFGKYIAQPAPSQEAIFTEYYSLQIDMNYCYFEYGVVEEPECMKYELHENYDFIESYCLVRKLKQLRVDIGFEEKREKLVYSLNTNLIEKVKDCEEVYRFHKERICEDIETSYQVMQSQEKAGKVKKLFKGAMLNVDEILSSGEKARLAEGGVVDRRSVLRSVGGGSELNFKPIFEQTVVGAERAGRSEGRVVKTKTTIDLGLVRGKSSQNTFGDQKNDPIKKFEHIKAETVRAPDGANDVEESETTMIVEEKTKNGETENSENGEKRPEGMEVEAGDEQPELVDVDPTVNVYEDLGQSDIEIIYDRMSHSNPLFEDHRMSEFSVNGAPVNLGDALTAGDMQIRTQEFEDFKAGKFNQKAAVCSK